MKQETYAEKAELERRELSRLIAGREAIGKGPFDTWEARNAVIALTEAIHKLGKTIERHERMRAALASAAADTNESEA